MENNFVFYKLRKTFGWNEEHIMELYRSMDYVVSPVALFSWMKRPVYEGYAEMPDEALAVLLNGFIAERRGMQDGKVPQHEQKLNNNIILRKLKIALSFRDEDIIALFELAGLRVGKAELNAFFRDPKHSHYRPCKDQFLRNFLRGMQLKFEQQ